MILGKVGENVYESFTVTDQNHNMVTGLVATDFSIKLYDPNGNEVSSTITVTIQEHGNGDYKSIFVPNIVGLWYLKLTHFVYFPWGKADDIQVFHNTFDTIGDMVTRILGLTQENFFIDETIFDSDGNMTSCRIRIYSASGSIGTNNDIIATYSITSSYTNKLMDYYRAVKL